MLFGLQSQVGDAGVLAGVLGGGGGRHDRRGGGGLGRERRQGQPERRRGEHHVGRVRRQVRVQVVLRVGHGAVQLQLRLHLKGEGRHVAMTILRDRTHGWGEKGGEHALTLQWDVWRVIYCDVLCARVWREGCLIGGRGQK